MTAPLKTIETVADVIMPEIGQRARSAARVLALAPTAQKDKALAAMADAIRARQDQILAANAEDISGAKASGTRHRARPPPSSTGSRSTASASPPWRTASTWCARSPIRSAR